MDISCKECGQEFKPSASRKTFCCWQCYCDNQAANAVDPITNYSGVCKRCGEATNRHHAYCSTTCFNLAKSATFKGNLKCKATLIATASYVKQCSWCNATYSTTNARNIFCNERCCKASHRQTDKAKRRKAFVETVPLSYLIKRDKGYCKLCNGLIDLTLMHPDPMSISIDHVIPVSKGGMHSKANTQLAHLICNVLKGNKG